MQQNIETAEAKEIEQFYSKTMQRIYSGSITKGKIISVKPDKIAVDIGYKTEGIIPTTEFKCEEIKNLKEGDDIEVFIERINDKDGILTLSKTRSTKIRTWEMLAEINSKGTIIDGKIESNVKGGFSVDVKGIQAFMPSSQTDIVRLKDLDSYLGQVIPVKIIKLILPRNLYSREVNNGLNGSVVVSRRLVIEEQKQRQMESIAEMIKPDAIVKGIVKNITKYGVFVNIGGIDALLRISDVSWGRVHNINNKFCIGDEKEFKVLTFDKKENKITLGYKQLKPDIWLSIDEKYQEDMVIKGNVVAITHYGLFIEIEDGLEGLVHISEIDWGKKSKQFSKQWLKLFAIGSEVNTKIIRINKEERKISLSIKKLKPKPWDIIEEKYKVGDKITGKIRTITDFGVFIKILEEIDGFVHISDISWIKHFKHPSDILKKGKQIETVILNIDAQKERIILGIKQLTTDHWESEISSRLKVGDIVKCKVLRITEFGLFVSINGLAEGLVYSSEMDKKKEIKEGDEIYAKILKININDKKIGLGMKGF